MKKILVHLNSKPWAVINSRPMVFSEMGNTISIEWGRIQIGLKNKNYDILDELDMCLGFNHIRFARVYSEIFSEIAFTSHHIYKVKNEYNLQMITPRSLGFVKNPKTGEGVPTFKEFILKALVSGYVLCPFHVPVLFCLGSNFKNFDSESLRFVTPGFNGVFRFELTKTKSEFILNPIKIDDDSLVYLDFPHVFLQPDPKHRKGFLKSMCCKEEYPAEQFPELYKSLDNVELVYQ